MKRSPKRKRPGDGPPERTRKTLGLPTELARRLGAYAKLIGRTESDLAEEWIRDRLKGFYATTRGPAGGSDLPPPEGLRVAS